MPKQNKPTKKITLSKGDEAHLFGLQNFKKSLEKDFFAECNITHNLGDDNLTTNLIVSLNCNFNLTDILFHLNNDNWGGFLVENKEVPRFERSIQDLIVKNERPLDILEFSIYLKDTSLIISNIYPQSITDSLGTILSTVSANFVHFTKGLTEMPYEIFLPVFKDKTFTDLCQSNFCTKHKECRKGYFDYWGLYFESNIENDPVIYDVKNKTITEGDLLLGY